MAEEKSPIKVSFADLTHTGQLIAANTFPLGISMVAAYAKQELGEEIELDIFKYPDDFSDYLDHNVPTIACFSNYSWNLRLGYAFAERIKQAYPETVILFGGPNFSDEDEVQEAFLSRYPAIDCYIEFEGEIGFVELFRALREVDFNWDLFVEREVVSPSLRFLDRDGQLVKYELAPKVDLEQLPSPYHLGFMDKFFDETLIPMMQTARGCPYKCTFCWEGGDYFRKVKRFSEERIKADLHYIAEHVKAPDLCIVDANFGMFKQDLDTTRELVKVQKEYGWPKTILTATAKNQKERTIEIVEMLGNTLPPTAAVQSTDDEVLKLIKRKNVSHDALVSLAKSVEKVGGQSEAELILCIEGDTREKHFQTIFDMLDADMTFIRMYQFMMIPGTFSARKETRELHKMVTKYRVLPRCFGNYRYKDMLFPVAEIEEICVANETMAYEDYQACRDMHLTVEIFNNDAIFADLIQLLRHFGLSRSQFIKRIHARVMVEPTLRDLYSSYREEEKRNLRDDPDELAAFTEEEGVIQQYIDQKYGTNELYKFRVICVFDQIRYIHEIAYDVARQLLTEMGHYSDRVEQYLTELKKISLMRKEGTLSTGDCMEDTFHYDFKWLADQFFVCDFEESYRPDGIRLEVKHTTEQAALIDSYVKQYGTDIIGLSRIVLRANMNRLYRSVHYAATDTAQQD